MSKALAAGFQSLVSRAAVSLVNNKGDIGDVLNELGSSASIKSLATSMVTAGVIAALPVDVVPALSAEQVKAGVTLTAAEQLQVNIVRSAIGASVDTAVSGGEFGDALTDSMLNAAVQSVGALAATEIGIAAKTGQISKAVQLVSHAALGCGIGAATGGQRGCVGGAVGGVVGEVVAKLYVSSQRGEHAAITASELNQLKDSGVQFSKLAGGLAALLAGGNVDVGASTAENAARNNALDTIWDVLNVLYDAGKIGYGYYVDDQGIIEEGFVDLAADAASTLIPFVPAGGTKAARIGAEEGYTVLYRAVKKEELDDLVRSGAFKNPFGTEGKYFSTSAEGAASYARQAFGSWPKEGPYTLVQTKIPTRDLTPEMRVKVDRGGIDTVVIPTDLLGKLSNPGVWTRSPLPGRLR